MADSEKKFFADLMDDYFAECDEHFSAVRRGLLLLETSYSKQVAEDLFRSFHTLKGLSGMVGYSEAEQLAHGIESYLRALTKGLVVLSQPGLETLMASAKVLEQTIAAHRVKTPIPDRQQILKSLDCLVSGQIVEEIRSQPAPTSTGSIEDPPPEKLEQIIAARKKGAEIWRLVFKPEAALAERGINVNTVRERLGQVGEIIHAMPKVVENDKVVFEFILAGPKQGQIFESWESDGISFEPFTPSKPMETGVVADTLSLRLTPSNIVRVELSRLDDLMQKIGELVIGKARLNELLNSAEAEIPHGVWRNLQETNAEMEKTLRTLREGVMRVRMVPVYDLFERMHFAVRELSRIQKKNVIFESFGGETEIDKYLVEKIMDPMLHMVRNAVSHGIESPEKRAGTGKPLEGRITMRASAVAESIVLEISDDGRGIDAEKIRSRAATLGQIKPGESLESMDILEIICGSGFTTLTRADVASGRGVGMAVVGKAVEELSGSLSLETEPGRGSSFFIKLPLSLALERALLVEVCGRIFAVPASIVEEIVEIKSDSVTLFENNEIVAYHKSVLPLVRLSELFRVDCDRTADFYGLVVRSGKNRVGIVVDRLLGQKEIVVHGLSDPLLQTPGISGVTELGDRTPILILDLKELTRMRKRT